MTVLDLQVLNVLFREVVDSGGPEEVRFGPKRSFVRRTWCEDSQTLSTMKDFILREGREVTINCQ